MSEIVEIVLKHEKSMKLLWFKICFVWIRIFRIQRFTGYCLF